MVLRPHLNLNRTYFFIFMATSVLLIGGSLFFPRWHNISTQTANLAQAADRRENANREQQPAQAPSDMAGHELTTATKAHLECAYGRLPMQFEINEGQVASDVRFVSRGRGYTLFLTPTEAVIDLSRRGLERNADGQRVNVAGRYLLHGKYEVGFGVEQYDKKFRLLSIQPSPTLLFWAEAKTISHTVLQ